MVTELGSSVPEPGILLRAPSLLRGRDNTHLWTTVADLLEYPRVDWKILINSTARLIQEDRADLSSRFEEFRQSVTGLELRTLQEAYLRSFDLDPDSTLEAGYHLFADDARRRMFLADLLEVELPFDLGEDYQPPDYLPIMLRLLPKLDNNEERKEFIKLALLPAVEKILRALILTNSLYVALFNFVRLALKDTLSALDHEWRIV